MNIDASNTVEYDVGEEVERAEAWEGDLATLADLTDTIRSAWHTKDMNVSRLAWWPSNIWMSDRLTRAI